MRKTCLCLLPALFAIALQAQDLRDERFMARARAGFDDMFNLDYEKAREVFVSLEKEYPRHPAPPLYLGVMVWMEELIRRQDLSLNRYISPSHFMEKTDRVMPAGERAAFFACLMRSEDRAHAILKVDPGNKDGRYFLSAIFGLHATFAITVDHSLTAAFKSGRQAYSYAEGLVKEDPEYGDAYLTVGVYEYVVGSIPWYIKWLPFIIGVRGGKDEGMEHVKRASEKGIYVRNEALLVAMVLDVRERRYAEALKTARSLSEKYPRNFLFLSSYAQILKLAGERDLAVAAFTRMLEKAEAKEPNFDKLELGKLRYDVGVSLLESGRSDLASELFRRSVSDPLVAEREKALSHLHLGRILERKGKLAEATAEYKKVLSLKNFDESHTQAKKFLEK